MARIRIDPDRVMVVSQECSRVAQDLEALHNQIRSTWGHLDNDNFDIGARFHLNQLYLQVSFICASARTQSGELSHSLAATASRFKEADGYPGYSLEALIQQFRGLSVINLIAATPNSTLPLLFLLGLYKVISGRANDNGLQMWTPTNPDLFQSGDPSKNQARTIIIGQKVQDSFDLKITDQNGQQHTVSISSHQKALYQRYQNGEIDFKTLTNELARNKNLVDVDMNLAKKQFEGEVAWKTTGPVETGIGTVEGSLGKAEGQAGYGLKLKDGITAEASAMGGAYLAHGSYSKDIAGIDLAAAAFAGAQASGKMGAYVDPAKGDLGLKAGVDAFAGAKAEGNVSTTIEEIGVGLGVHGSLNAGAGGQAKANIGFQHGTFKFEAGAGFALGVGAELGVSFEVDVIKAGSILVDAGIEASNLIMGL